MYRIKPWEDLTIQDDYMFKLIMGVKRICLNLLQGILRVEIKDIHYLETEKSMDARYQGKGVRMDVYVRDDANTVYNIEMQVRMLEGESLFKRTRYYQSMIDAELLAAGADYDDLNNILYPRMWTRRKKGWGKTLAKHCSDENDSRQGESFFMYRSRGRKLPLRLTGKPISMDSHKKAESLEHGQSKKVWNPCNRTLV